MMHTTSTSFLSSSPEETRDVGARIGARLWPGAVLALHGELGSGKTCLVQGLAEGLGLVPPARVSSPSFVIINEYPARIPLFHFDLYRLPDGRELIELGWEDYLERGGVIAIEWAERMRDLLPADHLRVTMEVTGEKTRRITLHGRGVERFAAAEEPTSGRG
jgi:tRNA threonylcarbamoyladenosine biosynthesis protein TsaE